MGIVSGYTLDLYCDAENEDHSWQEFPHEYLDPEKGSACRRMARKAGWIINEGNNYALCPKCNKKTKTTNQEQK